MRRAALTIAIVFSAGAALSAAKFVSKDEFVGSIVGKTISSTDKKGLPFTAVFKPDGTGDFQKKGKKPATFEWSYAGQTVCWDFGDFKECNKVEIASPTSAKFYDAESGKLNNAYRVK